MSTVRRLYFYGLALLSAEVVIWGVIQLLRTLINDGFLGGGSALATGLSLVLVGIPIFWIHWRVAQRDALRETEEHASRIRAVFLYAALFATLLPMVYAALALVNRWLTTLFGHPAYRAWFGADGTARDNLIAMLINAAALAYFWFILRKDWQTNLPGGFLSDARRFYRYVWLLFGLIMSVAGIYNLIMFALPVAQEFAPDRTITLAAGITLALIGIPIWAYHEWVMQSVLGEAQERQSLLRLVVLYLISLAGVVGVVATAARVLHALIRWLLGQTGTFTSFLQNNAETLALAMPLAVMWWYYGGILSKEVDALPDLPMREGLGRLYRYILSALGLVVTFVGLINLVAFLARAMAGPAYTGSLRSEWVLQSQLSGALAALLVGAPLWLVPWRKMQREAARLDDTGDHARRSVIRKAYLYLALFLLVVGAMFFTGSLLYTLIDALITGASADFAQEVISLFLSLVIDSLLLVYHWRALRQDSITAQQTLGDLHADFPTLVLLEEKGVFGEALLEYLQKVAPRLPVALHPIERGAPDETMLGAKAVLLPLGMAIAPPESLKLWLDEYQGRRALIPLPEENWQWLGLVEKSEAALAQETARALRQMAEGETVRAAASGGPWAVASYILGGIFGLLLLMFLFSLIVSSLFQ